MSQPKTLEQRKRDGDCYFCSAPAKDSRETVNGKPDDHKICAPCFVTNRGAIEGARRMAAAWPF